MNKKYYVVSTMLLFFAILFSCRPDILVEQDARDQSQIPSLTSKIISLNESVHRNKILPELKFAKQTLFKKSTNTFGKVVNFGDSVSIDTDHVIYIENGNYHNYIFKMNRSNPVEGTPIENLLLTPLPDGSYKEFVITYSLTNQELQFLEDGDWEIPTNRIKMTELLQGTYNNGQLAKNINCLWSTVIVGYTACSQNAHFEGETSACSANIKSQAIYGGGWDCTDVSLTTTIDDGTGGNTDGGYGGPVYCPECPAPAEPCPDSSILDSPQDPSTLINGDCNPLIPILPNLGGSPNTKTPCEKIKEQREDNNYNKRIDTLQQNTGMTKETGYIQKWGGSYEYKDNAGATATANTLSLPEVASNTWMKAFMHTHVDDIPNSDRKGIKMFSPADVGYFMNLVQNAQTNAHSLSDTYGVMVTSTQHYQIRFTGSKFQIKTFTKSELDIHNDFFSEAMNEYIGKPKQLELRFLKYIQEKMLLYGITLYRLNSDGTTTEIKLNIDKTDTVENTCPN